MASKILMVCLGNICRSPLAEGILASKLPKNKFTVDSAGTGSWHVGHSPDERSIAIAKKNKIPIIENPALARSLYDQIDVDREIPSEFYKAMAEVFSYVYELKRKR